LTEYNFSQRHADTIAHLDWADYSAPSDQTNSTKKTADAPHLARHRGQGRRFPLEQPEILQNCARWPDGRVSEVAVERWLQCRRFARRHQQLRHTLLRIALLEVLRGAADPYAMAQVRQVQVRPWLAAIDTRQVGGGLLTQTTGQAYKIGQAAQRQQLNLL
jgi:hypothetical protein